jgi:cation-transporting ATPase E
VARVLAFAVPCGAVAAAATLVAYFAVAGPLPLTEARTTATAVLVVCGLWVLALLARPFTPLKAVLVAAMGASFATMLAIAPVRRYFALTLPPVGRAAWAVCVVVVAGAALELVYRIQRGRAGLVVDG